MRKSLFAAAGLAALSFAVAAPAASISFAEHLPGSEVRRSTTQGDELREEVLHLYSDGRLSGNYQVTRPNLPGGGVEHRQGKIFGRWTLDGARLCLAGKGLSDGPESCYDLTKAHRGKRQYAAVNARTGEIWQVFIYPDEVR